MAILKIVTDFFIQYGEFIGLIIGFLGAVMATVSVSPFSKSFGEGGTTTGDDGKEREFVYLTKPFLARISVVVIVVGFIFQLIGMALNL